MLIEEDAATIAAFKAAKREQGTRALHELGGGSLICAGQSGTQIMLRFERDGFAEGVVIGQMAQVHLVASGSRVNPILRDAPNDKKPIEKRAVDLTDAQVDAVIGRWLDGRSAADLPFITHVYDASGKLQAA
jgi:hypothetical protein